MRGEIKETASCRMTDSDASFKKPLNIIKNNNTSDENGSQWSLFIKRMRPLFHRNFGLIHTVHQF